MTEPLQTPASPHTEQTILGACLVDEVALNEAVDALQPSDFFTDGNRRIFAAIVALRKAGSTPDIVTVSDYLVDRKEIDAAGGRAYVIDLPTGLPRKLNIVDYIRTVRDKSRARSLINLAERAAEEASDGQEEAQVVLLRTIEEFRELAEQHPDSDLLSVGAILEAQGPPESMLERLTTLEGVKLGFDNIDANTHGLQPETLNIVAARPSMGKTAWMCKAARHSAVIEEKITAVFTLEQKKETMIRRMLSIESRVAYDDILTGSLTPHHGRMMLEQREMLLKAPLYLDDQPGLTVSRIKSKCMRLKRTMGLDIVFVDQLSKVSNADVYQKGMPKSEWVGKQSAAFKLMAQELKVPVVVFNQLKRPDGKGAVMPTLSDLKESGSLEEDADVVIFLHRPEYYDKGDENLRDKGQMILAKNREGRTDTFDCTFKGSIMRWEDGQLDSSQGSLIDEYVLPHWQRE